MLKKAERKGKLFLAKNLAPTLDIAENNNKNNCCCHRRRRHQHQHHIFS